MNATMILALALPCLAPVAHAASTVKASSELKRDDGTQRASHAFDGRLRTAWVQGDEEGGEPAWLEVGLDGRQIVESVSIWPGDLGSGRRSLREHARPRTITLIFGGTGSEDVEIQGRLPDYSRTEPGRFDVRIDEPIEASSLRIRIDEVHPTFVDEHVAIAEVGVNFVSGEVPRGVEKALAWAESKVGVRSSERTEERVRELHDILVENDEDAGALDELIDYAADGTGAQQSQAAQVPYGYRVHAVLSSEVAIDALLKLKNPNGIPGVELAAIRARGKAQKTLGLKTEIFYAYQELLGGPAPVPNWGRTGWEQGALRGFGEPLNLEGDQLGQTYVADIGNHRVQRFDDQGALVGTWGACDAPDIANRWFTETRQYHVTGCLPSEADGGFVNPLDVAILPGKNGDGFAVLDVTGRIQLFDESGQHTLTFDAGLGSSPVPGVGGQGFLDLIKGKLVAVMGDEVGVYSLGGEKLSSFVLEYGGSSGAVGLKNGKLGLVQGRDLVMYSFDGFNHGPVLTEAQLGTDFEYWDVAIDAKKYLWVVTDSNRVLRYKKPGKIEWEGTFEGDGQKLRIHVINGVVFILQGDQISLFDTGTGS